MPLTVVQKQVLNLGSAKGTISTITFDSSYPTGGEDLTAADLGLSQVFGIIPMLGTGGYTFSFVQSTGKLLAYNGTAQITNAANLATVVVDILAIGT